MSRLHAGILAPALALAVLTLSGCADGTLEPADARPLAQAEGFPGRGEVRTGYILNAEGRPARITYEEKAGLAVWQGDIVLGAAGSVAQSREELLRTAGPRLGVAVRAQERRWTGGVVLYQLPYPWKTIVERTTTAMNHINSQTSGMIRFVPRTDFSTEPAHIMDVIPVLSGCGVSQVGRNGRTEVYVGPECTVGNIIHEIGHVLGLEHEQNRCDRNSYVNVLWNNMPQDWWPQFTVDCTTNMDVLSYDEGSIMHYPAYATIDGQTVQLMQSLRGRIGQMGQRTGLSSTDVSVIRQIYSSSSSSVEPPPQEPGPGGGEYMTAVGVVP
jgi:hypothetical protein